LRENYVNSFAIQCSLAFIVAADGTCCNFPLPLLILCCYPLLFLSFRFDSLHLHTKLTKTTRQDSREDGAVLGLPPTPSLPSLFINLALCCLYLAKRKRSLPCFFQFLVVALALVAQDLPVVIHTLCTVKTMGTHQSTELCEGCQGAIPCEDVFVRRNAAELLALLHGAAPRCTRPAVRTLRRRCGCLSGTARRWRPASTPAGARRCTTASPLGPRRIVFVPALLRDRGQTVAMQCRRSATRMPARQRVRWVRSLTH